MDWDWQRFLEATAAVLVVMLATFGVAVVLGRVALTI